MRKLAAILALLTVPGTLMGQGILTGNYRKIFSVISIPTNAAAFVNNTTQTVTLPAGSTAGQLALMFTAAGVGGTSPTPNGSGWTTQCTATGTTWQGGIYSRTLTSGDISTGSLSATQGGAFDTGGGVIMVAVLSSSGGIREFDPSGGTCRQSGSSPNTISTTSGVVAGDRGVCFGSIYSTSVALTISPGVAQSPTPTSGVDGSSEHFIGLVSALSMPAGVTNFVFTFTGAHFINGCAIVEP